MRGFSFRAVDQLCQRLALADRSSVVVNRLVDEAIRQRVLDKSSLLMVLQRLGATEGRWELALRILQCRAVAQHDLLHDANIWRIVKQGVPRNAESQDAAHRVLCATLASTGKERGGRHTSK